MLIARYAAESAHRRTGVSAPHHLQGKNPVRVQARSVAAYWVVRHLSISGVEVGKKLGIGQSAISRAVKRGEKLVREVGLVLE